MRGIELRGVQKRRQLLQELNELNNEFCRSCTVPGVTPHKCKGCSTYRNIRRIGLALDNIASERRQKKIEREERFEIKENKGY